VKEVRRAFFFTESAVKIFMLVLEDVLSISRLWVVVSDISYVFLKTEFQASAGLTNISLLASIAG
jgi:hypothetical protein